MSNGERDILSRSESETNISVIDRRTLRGEEEVQGLRRWFKFHVLGEISIHLGSR